MRDFETGNSGFISLHRSVLNKNYSTDELALWVTLLLLANHQEGYTRDGVQLRRGEFKTGRRQLAELTGINEFKIERILRRFEDAQQLHIKCTTKYRIISITNYDRFQAQSDVLHTNNNNNKNNKETTSGETTENPAPGKRPKKSSARFDFESLYQLYPRREAKERGMKKLQKQIQTEADFELLSLAVKKYAQEREGEDSNYTLNWANFADRWREILERPEKKKPARIGYF